MSNASANARAYVAAAFLLLLPYCAQAYDAVVAYDNGGIGHDTVVCLSGPNQCGASFGRSWTLYNPFSLDAATDIVGFRNWNGTSSADSYIETRWSVWTERPGPSTLPVFSGTSVATIESDHDFNMATVLGLDLMLAPGSYWIGISHQTTAPWTYVTPSVWINGAIQSDGVVYYDDAGMGQMAFQLLAVPEPNAVSLFASGLTLVWLLTKGRRPRLRCRPPSQVVSESTVSPFLAEKLQS